MKVLSVLWMLCKANLLNILIGLVSTLFIKQLEGLLVIGLGSCLLMLSVFTMPILMLLLALVEKIPYSRDAKLAWFAFVSYVAIAICTYIIACGLWELYYLDTLIPLVPSVWIAVKTSANGLLKSSSPETQAELSAQR